MQTVALNDGVAIPQIGFGTFQIPAGAEPEKAVAFALTCGCRHIDTAAAYFNEADVGRAVCASGIKRDEKTVAVQWECSGTFNGEVPFAGLQPNGRKFTTTVMNFYSFDLDGKICKDVAATGIAGILQGISHMKGTPK